MIETKTSVDAHKIELVGVKFDSAFSHVVHYQVAGVKYAREFSGSKASDVSQRSRELYDRLMLLARDAGIQLQELWQWWHS